MPPDDAIRLRHMLDAARSAQEFATGRSRGDLATDKMLTFAVVRAIEILGEAASRISAETRLAEPSIPWAEIVAMRNRLIHAYFDVDLDILWKDGNNRDP
jgi:uncharacterized protein with HEPN domain